MKSQTEVSLLPCPFCGHTAAPGVYTHQEVHSIEDEGACGQPDSYVACCDVHNGGCGACGGYSTNRTGAAESWNRRTN